MELRRKRLVGQLAILGPTLMTSFVLGRSGVARLPRLGASLLVGMISIFLVGVWLRSPSD